MECSDQLLDFLNEFDDDLLDEEPITKIVENDEN